MQRSYLSIRLEALQESPYAFASSYEEEKNQAVEKYKNRFAPKVNSFTFGSFEEDELVGVVTFFQKSFLPSSLSDVKSLLGIQ